MEAESFNTIPITENVVLEGEPKSTDCRCTLVGHYVVSHCRRNNKTTPAVAVPIHVIPITVIPAKGSGTVAMSISTLVQEMGKIAPLYTIYYAIQF
ncbi:hypothetical protein V6N13_042464 [Hibiscus sabdariffa]|uniref:Uncharacterized protein n=1 Tax=Hibiscus sabdariffa TaxID=183260 RepID=A0ABR2G4M0_9ROSI